MTVVNYINYINYTLVFFCLFEWCVEYSFAKDSLAVHFTIEARDIFLMKEYLCTPKIMKGRVA